MFGFIELPGVFLSIPFSDLLHFPLPVFSTLALHQVLLALPSHCSTTAISPNLLLLPTHLFPHQLLSAFTCLCHYVAPVDACNHSLCIIILSVTCSCHCLWFGPCLHWFVLMSMLVWSYCEHVAKPIAACIILIKWSGEAPTRYSWAYLQTVLVLEPSSWRWLDYPFLKLSKVRGARWTELALASAYVWNTALSLLPSQTDPGKNNELTDLFAWQGVVTVLVLSIVGHSTRGRLICSDAYWRYFLIKYDIQVCICIYAYGIRPASVNL